jgi:hypothetical protein
MNDTGGKIAACINNTGGIWQHMANFSPVSMTPAANFATSFACVVDTGGPVNDIGGKFATGVIDTCGK